MSRETRKDEDVDIAVIGDGLIGYSIALHLQRAGFRTGVVGADKPGRASTAAAGMLTPACEYDPWMPRAFLDLLRAGLEYYPRFLDGGWTTPDEVGYRRTDFTLLDLHERTDRLEDRMEWMPGLGIECRWLSPGQACEWEPHLSPTAFRGAIRIRDEAQVNPIALWERLRAVTAGSGAVLHSGGLTGLAESGNRLVVSTGDDAHLRADRMVIAAGAWSAAVARLAGLHLPVCPVKGQMIRLSGPPALIGSVIFMPAGGCGSVVERAPGSYIAGTSEEYLGPSPTNTAGVLGRVLSRLTTVIPQAGDWCVEETWAGFRPMTSDELPIIDVTRDERIFAATGHHRNGILLAPLTGRLVADLMTGKAVEIDMHQFRYDRALRPHTRFASKF